MRMNRVRSPGREAGFTLIELVITVAIMGIISGALIGVVFQYLKVTSANRTRLSESTDQQFISAYWQQDVSSLGKRTFTPDDTTNPVPSAASVFTTATAGDCGYGVGSPIVRFEWTAFEVGAATSDAAWAATSTQSVAYVLVPAGDAHEIKRVRCGGVSDSTFVVAHNVTRVDELACDPSPCTTAGLPERVSMRFTVKDTSEKSVDTSYTTTVTADRRQG